MFYAVWLMLYEFSTILMLKELFPIILSVSVQSVLENYFVAIRFHSTKFQIFNSVL